MTVYLNGDTHGRFTRVALFCAQYNLKSDDVVVISYEERKVVFLPVFPTKCKTTKDFAPRY